MAHFLREAAHHPFTMLYKELAKDLTVQVALLGTYAMRGLLNRFLAPEDTTVQLGLRRLFLVRLALTLILYHL